MVQLPENDLNFYNFIEDGNEVPPEEQRNGSAMPDEDDFYEYYDTMEVLGKGLSSVVRRCVEKSSGKQYAVKIMDVSDDKNLVDAEGRSIEEQVQLEINVLKVVSNHEYIVTLHQVFCSSPHYFLIFELCTKGELFDFLNNSVILSEKKCKIIFKQILEAVAHCHKLGIVHRDLKPENILLDDNNIVKLTDFGFARKIKHTDRLFETCGTPGYLAPEVLMAGMVDRNKCTGYNIEVDAWACGVIMYTMCVGKPPFYHRKQLLMIRSIMEGKYSKNCSEWDNITNETKDLIERLLTVNPKDRLTIEEALQHESFVSNKVLLFNAKKSFRIAILCVRFLVRFKRICSTPEQVPVSTMREEPYAIKLIRKDIDDKSFHVYNHWILNTNKGLLYQLLPKKQCLRHQVMMSDKHAAKQIS
ncbi:phosphorylase b kinase gamma catalytic chain, skeletal muscle/heart isoform [Lepeophtheirus salmonis]|uniref:phosphorylase b kinase gamma catalytic chain, skeletal muscle/heart isoform n=1 Tax=Lepeophtheirus salmonis TaxID=72036 RepID=UPI001AE1656D|nr:phosphorylase b kinase gamma catalytic chain, skeletal muscle/heart isoform-like [Lepeophtheirus salmonis]